MEGARRNACFDRFVVLTRGDAIVNGTRAPALVPGPLGRLAARPSRTASEAVGPCERGREAVAGTRAGRDVQ